MAGAPAGYDVFLSYGRADATAAETLRARLRDAGLTAFLDRYALPADRPWQPELEAALASCRALLVLLGPSGIGGWQHREIQLALDRQNRAPFPVVPVLLPRLQPDDLPLGTFLALNTWVDLRQGLDQPEAQQRLLAAVQGRAIDGLTRDLAGLRPYRGLLAFREQDAGLFFGRERFVAELVAKVRQRSAANVIAVLGRSGSGKSSVVFAGLFPALRKEKVWQVLDLRPGAEPLHALIEALDPPDDGLSRSRRIAEINDGVVLLRKGRLTLAQIVRDRLKDDPGTTRLLLYVDQWEELYTQAQPREPTTDEEKARAADARLFVDFVLDAAAKSPCTLVLSVRSDFYPDLQTHDALRAAVQDCQVSLGPMTAAELTAAIEGPARALGGSVEPELTKKLLRDIGLDSGDLRSDHPDIGKLPLLEFALEQTWAKSDSGRLGLAHYRGLEQELENRANRVYNGLRPDQQAVAKRLFISLVTLGEGQEDTRARVALEPTSELAGAAEAFAAGDARLVVTGEEGQRRIVEVSHEALIRHWETLRSWIRENRANLRTRAELIAGRNQWLEHKKDNTLLIPTGLRLEAARALKAQPSDVEIKDLLEYIDASDNAEIAGKQAAEAARIAEHQRELDAANRLAEQARHRADAEARAAHEQQQRAEAEARTADEQRQRADAEQMVAEEQRQRADAEVARARSLRWTTIVVASAAVITAGLAGYTWHAKSQLQQEVDRTTAALIWAKLDFEDWARLSYEGRNEINDPKNEATVRALWDLATSGAAVRDAFVEQLAQDRYQVDTLARAPDVVARAFGLRPDPIYTERLLTPILAAIPRTTDPYQLGVLARAIQALGPTPQQAQAALGPALDAIRQTTGGDERAFLEWAVESLGPKLASKQAQAALGLVLKAIRQADDTDDLRALAKMVETLGYKLTPEQAQQALDSFLDAIRQADDPYRLQALARAIHTLGPTPEQAQAVLGPVLAAIRQTTDSEQLLALAQAVQILRPTQVQAQGALGPILAAIRETTDPEQLLALAQAIQTLGPTPEQADAALDPVLEIIPHATNLFEAQALAQAVQALGPKLAPERAQAILDIIRNAILETTNHRWLEALAGTVQALGSELAREQAQQALGPVVDAIRQAADPYQLQALARTVQILRPTQVQAQGALGPILAAIRETTDPEQLQALAQAVQTLGPTPEQAQVALGPVLTAIRRTSGTRDLLILFQGLQTLGPELAPEQAQQALGAVLDVIRLTPDAESYAGPGEELAAALAQTAQTIGSKLAPQQAQAALGLALDAIRQTADTGDVLALARVIQTLGPTAEQAQAALDPVFDAIRQTGNTGDLLNLAQAVEILGPKLAPEQADAEIEIVRTVLAATNHPQIATAFARAIALTLPFDSAKLQSYVAAIVKVLKWPTTAEPGATEALLEVLHDRVSEAPGEEAGLDATVQWVADAFPEIDLDSPPTPPASASTGGAW